MNEIFHGIMLPLVYLNFDGISPYEIFPSLYMPIMMMYYIGFFVTFDFAPNFYAEFSGFADRQFYTDFWNATTMDEYARKWNRFVHEFLHRHFFLETLKRYRVTQFQAMVWTFLFSVIFHELFFTVSFGRVSFFLSCLQIN